MDRRTLTDLFAAGLYRIPEYQRGYAWEEKQWNDFIQDIDAIVDDGLPRHYTGTVVTFKPPGEAPVRYGPKWLQVIEVVDGQQRLTTSCLYLGVILRALVDSGETAFEREVVDFLHSGTTCKMTLNDSATDVLYDLLRTGRSNREPRSPHEGRLIRAYAHLAGHVESQTSKRGDAAVAYLKELHHAITQQLNFTYYEVEEEHEIGMTFELMNSRGKGLSILELLKNYLMYWVYRNAEGGQEKSDLTSYINKNWKDAYENLGRCDGDEDQCLRVAWTLYCTHTPKYWDRYEGFKRDEYVPLRNFSKRSKEDTKNFIRQFVGGLAEVSGYYAAVVAPSRVDWLTPEEHAWLTKIHNAGNIANFLPLLVAVLRHRVAGTVKEADSVEVLKALECYTYRVYLYAGRRSNAGKSNFYRLAYDLLGGTASVEEVIREIGGLTGHYNPEREFLKTLDEPSDWYSARHRLKYTLYEYEVHLLKAEGHQKRPHLRWGDLKDSTLEHILPQTPAADSRWLQTWNKDDIAECLHDIGNLVLTHDNSRYRNFEFERKRGAAGLGPSYAHSDIRQERKLSACSDWRREDFNQRRGELVAWIKDRWRTGRAESVIAVVDEDDEDVSESREATA